MSHKEPMFYRAPDSAGAPNLWESDHFIRLGTFASFQSKLTREIEDLALEIIPDAHMAAGQGIFNGTLVLVTVHLDPESGEGLWFGFANCIESSLIGQLKKRFDVQAFDHESCQYI